MFITFYTITVCVDIGSSLLVKTRNSLWTLLVKCWPLIGQSKEYWALIGWFSKKDTEHDEESDEERGTEEDEYEGDVTGVAGGESPAGVPVSHLLVLVSGGEQSHVSSLVTGHSHSDTRDQRQGEQQQEQWGGHLQSDD